MNSLSWMIYLAELSQSIGFVCGIAGIVYLIVAVVKTMNVHSEDFGDGSVTKAAAKSFFGRAGKVALPLLLIATLVPSKATIYAIAASEMGETALNSETGGKAVQALNAWLDRQIAGEAEDK